MIYVCFQVIPSQRAKDVLELYAVNDRDLLLLAVADAERDEVCGATGRVLECLTAKTEARDDSTEEIAGTRAGIAGTVMLDETEIAIQPSACSPTWQTFRNCARHSPMVSTSMR